MKVEEETGTRDWSNQGREATMGYLVLGEGGDCDADHKYSRYCEPNI